MISANTQSISASEQCATVDLDYSDWDGDSYPECGEMAAIGADSRAPALECPLAEQGEPVRLSAELTRNRLTVRKLDGMVVIDFGRCEIWDGSDLSILRETMACLLDAMQFREVGINMQHAKSLASGFFGLLHDWHLRGVTVQLKEPQPCVKDMLWFREFCVEAQGGWYVLERRPEAEELELRTYARLSRPTWRWGRPDEPTP